MSKIENMLEEVVDGPGGGPEVADLGRTLLGREWTPGRQHGLPWGQQLLVKALDGLRAWEGTRLGFKVPFVFKDLKVEH